jgi:hypothetical protein
LKKKNGDRKMNTRKKIIAGLMTALIIGTIGIVGAVSQTNGTAPDQTTQPPAWNTQNRTRPFDCFPNHHDEGFGYNLSTEQQTELNDLMTTLRNENVSPLEIRTAIEAKLESFGVFDTQLDKQITQAQERLTILNREKELRNLGYNWTQVRQMITDEFDTDNTTNRDVGMMPGNRYRQGPRRGPHQDRSDENGGQANTIPDETIEQ